MGIIAKAAGDNFVLCPAGTHAGICVDVVDMGIVETEFQGEKRKQHKVRIVWQVDEFQDNGRQHTAQKRYTLSLHEKAALRKDLESWRGRPFTAQELEGFDLEVLLGAPALLSVIHESRNGKTYDNVASIMRLPKMMEPPKVSGYVRVCDRKKEAPATDLETYAPSDDLSDSVPF